MLSCGEASGTAVGGSTASAEAIAGVISAFGDLDGASFVSARQENLETIHQHNVVAERHGLMSELRYEVEMGGPPVSHQTKLDEWLDGSSRGPTRP